MKPLTIKDIAALSGVGIATVSRVLNNHPDVSQETKRKVLEVVELHNYTPNANAKNLKQRNANLVSLIVRGRQNSFLTDIAERIIEAGSRRNQKFLPDFIDEAADEFETARHHMAEKKVRGILFLGSNIVGRAGEIAALPLPCVFATVDTSTLRVKGVSSISVDNRQSARMAVDHLLDRGHRRIAVFGGRREVDDGIGQRYQGVVQAYAARGLAYDESLYVQCSFQIEKAYRTALSFLEKAPGFTAVFAMSDIIALAVIRALHDRGLFVPKDVSVVGFDGILLCRYTLPALTTVAQPADRIAEGSVDLMLRLLKDPADSENILLKSALTQGGTVRPLTGY